MALTVRWTRTAISDLESAFEFISLEASRPAAAKSTIENILKCIKQLQSFPESGREGRVKGTRELVVSHTPYIIVYRYKKTTIEMLAILHTARRWPS